MILSRDLLTDGNISFSLGTRFGGTITRDNEEIPLANIYDYVTPQELQRYETQEFLDEERRDEAELAARAKHKPRGRPRKDAHVLFQLADGTPTKRSNLPVPAVIISKSSKKKSRGRPRKTSAPSFNGPQPTYETPPPRVETTSSRVSSEGPVDSDSSVLLAGPRQYAMVQASGLAPPTVELDEGTSGDITPAREDLDQTPKKQGSFPTVVIPSSGTPRILQSRPALEISDSQPDTLATGNNFDVGTSSCDDSIVDTPTKQPNLDLETESSEEEQSVDQPTERELLLRQFQVSTYRPQSLLPSSSESQASRATMPPERSTTVSRTESPQIALDQSSTSNQSSIKSKTSAQSNKYPRRISLTPFFPYQSSRTKTPVKQSIFPPKRSSSSCNRSPSPELSAKIPLSTINTRIFSSPTAPPSASASQKRKRTPSSASPSPAISTKFRKSASSLASNPLPPVLGPSPLDATNDITKYFAPKPKPRPVSITSTSSTSSEDPINRRSSPPKTDTTDTATAFVTNDKISSNVLLVDRRAQRPIIPNTNGGGLHYTNNVNDNNRMDHEHDRLHHLLTDSVRNESTISAPPVLSDEDRRALEEDDDDSEETTESESEDENESGSGNVSSEVLAVERRAV